MATERTALEQLLETMRLEGGGDRGVFYELYGSGIREALLPLAELLELNLETNPELVELTALSFSGDGASSRAQELREIIEAKRSAASDEVTGEPKLLWKFEWDVGRMGTVESTFVATQSEIDAAVGEQVYFGEILGKHSDVYGPLEAKDLEVISRDPNEIAVFERTVGSTGHNPLDYIEDYE